ncbi:MAG: hypothetical protein V4450_10050 [Bacteroidota bacterium]
MSSKPGYIKQVFSRLFNIQKGESKDVILLLCFSFITGVSFVFYSTATVSVFISSFKADALPFAFIASGIVGYLLWYAFAKVQRYLAFGNLLLFGYLFLLLSIAFLFIMAHESGNKWWYFSMFVWMRFFTFLNAVMFGGLVARIFNLQQGKRLYGLISAGDVVSQMLGYFSIPLLIHSFGVSTLFMISISGILIHLLVILYVKRTYSDRMVQQAKTPAAATSAETNLQTGKNWKQYIRLIFIVSLLPMLGFYYVDYMFLNELRIEYTSKEAVAGFLGLFLGGVAIVELFTRLFLSGRLLTKYGLKFGINILPMVLTASTVLIIFFAVIPGFGGLVFSILALSKLLERVLRFSFNEPAFQIFYQPVPPEQRFSFRTMMEGVPKALGVIIAGLLILGFNLLGLRSAVYLNLLFLTVLLTWLYTTRESYKSYCMMLKVFVQQKFSKESAPKVVDKQTPLQKGITLYPGKVYSIPAANEWEEYQHLSRTIDSSFSENSINERHCVEFMVKSVLPGTYFSGWITKGHMIGQLLKARFAASISLVEQLRITELMADAGDAVFLKEQLYTKYPLLALFAARKIKAKGGAGLQLEGKDRQDYKGWMDNLVACIVWYEACYADIADDEQLQELCRHIAKEKDLLVELLFLSLSFIYDPAAVLEIEESLVKKPSADGRMLAHELLENFFDDEIKDTIIGLFAYTTPAEKLHSFADSYPQKRMEVNERLEDILLKAYQLVPLYIKVLALEQIGKQGSSSQEKILIENLQNVHPLLALTAGELLSRKNPELYTTCFNRLALVQQKMITTADEKLNAKIVAFTKVPSQKNMATALILPMAEAWLEDSSRLTEPTSTVLIPLDSEIQLSDGDIIFHDGKDNVLVLKNGTLPNNCLVFKEKAASLVGL